MKSDRAWAGEAAARAGGSPFVFARSEFSEGHATTMVSLLSVVTAFTAHLHTGGRGCSRFQMSNKKQLFSQ